jgi:two-component system, OmpR family, osmolarity sensor histidine kinase EnvZ
MTKPAWKNFKQRLLPRTLYGRSMMIIVLPVFLLQLIVAYVFIDRHWDSMSDKLVFALSGEIGMITEQVKLARTPDDILKIAQQAAALDIKVSIEDAQATVRLKQSGESLIWKNVEDKLRRALDQRLTEHFKIMTSPKDKRFEIHVLLDNQNAIKFQTFDRRLTSPATYVFLLLLIGSSIILMGVAIMFMRNQLRPIHRLAIAADKLGKGQDVADFKLEGAREVRQAAGAFLEMRNRIRRQIEQRTAMLAGVSHDLRTPLTRMKLQLEKMLEGYLTFARGEGNEPTERVNLKSVLDRIVANAARQNFSVEAHYNDNLQLRARPMAIERALSNVVTNACKYAKHVWVTAAEQGSAIEVSVDDDGPGIPSAQREEVFKPFFRLEKSRNPKTGGVGLGLSIAQDIVHGHGGEIFLEESNRGGLRVVMRFPL